MPAGRASPYARAEPPAAAGRLWGGRVSASGGALAPVGAAVRVGRLPVSGGSSLWSGWFRPLSGGSAPSDLCVGRAPALVGPLCPHRAVHLVWGSPPRWGRPLPLPGGSAHLRAPRPCSGRPPPLPDSLVPARSAHPYQVSPVPAGRLCLRRASGPWWAASGSCRAGRGLRPCWSCLPAASLPSCRGSPSMVGWPHVRTYRTRRSRHHRRVVPARRAERRGRAHRACPR